MTPFLLVLHGVAYRCRVENSAFAINRYDASLSCNELQYSAEIHKPNSHQFNAMAPWILSPILAHSQDAAGRSRMLRKIAARPGTTYPQKYHQTAEGFLLQQDSTSLSPSSPIPQSVTTQRVEGENHQGNRMNVKLISPSPTGAASQTGQIASPARRDRSKFPRTLCGQLSPPGAQSS